MDDIPQVIPQIEPMGSRTERLNTLDALIARFRELRRALRDDGTDTNPYELYGPYINAPVWPWNVAGWGMALFFMLMFLMTWLGS